jgi:ATP-dependent helicase/nuclease subunit B
MSVRFVVGRAGSGKTHRALESIRSILREQPRGPKLILLVPEQAALQMERALLAPSDIPGSTRCEVVSFRRLAQRLLEQSGRPIAPPIDKYGRRMVLGRLLASCRGKMSAFGRVARRSGFIERFIESISELFQECVDAEELKEAQERLKDQPGLSAKLGDLALVYSQYLETIREARLDPEQYLDLLVEEIDRSEWFENASIWAEGFAGFTGQETRVLAALAGRASRLEISLLIPPDAPIVRSNAAPIDELDIFARTQRTYRSLIETFSNAGIEIEDPVELTGAPPRFARSGELTLLESNLFSSNASVWNAPATDIAVLESPDPRTEVDWAAAEIRRLVIEEGLRYRDVAVILRDLDPYYDLIAATFREHNIPLFIDRRRVTVHHPAIELIRSAIEAATSDWDVTPMRRLLKSDLLGIDRADLDHLENYIIAHGARGSKWFSTKPWRRPRSPHDGTSREDGFTDDQSDSSPLDEARETLAERFGPWRKAGSQGGLTGHDWAKEIWELLDRLHVAERLIQWTDEAESRADFELAEEHRHVWNEIVMALDALAHYLGDQTLTLQDLGDILEAAFAGMDLGVAPPTIDQVLVGSIERSRHPELKAVLLLGFNQRVFPQVTADDPILRDGERRALADLGIRLRVPADQRFLEERMLAYIALSRASHRLYVSYAASDEEGRRLSPSPFLAELYRLFPILQQTAEGNESQSPTDGIERASTPARFVGALAEAIRSSGGSPSEEIAAYYEWARRQPRLQPLLNDIFPSLAYKNRATLDPDRARSAMIDRDATSVSRLESFASCPFQYFARHQLDLRPRQQFVVEPTDLGGLDHEILAKFMQALIDDEIDLAEITDETIRSRIEPIVTEAAETLRGDLMVSTARRRGQNRRTIRHLTEAVRAARYRAKAGRFRPSQIEWEFGFHDDAKQLPSLFGKTPEGRDLLIRGRVDRIDVAHSDTGPAACVIDYKRSANRRFDAARAYHGLDLQLPVYMLAVSREDPASEEDPRCVAGVYVNLIHRYKRESHPADIDKDEASIQARLKPRGIFERSAIEMFDPLLEPGNNSKVVSIRINKDGNIGRSDSSDAIESDQLRALLDHVAEVAGRMFDELSRGRIAISPYRYGIFSPCTHCDFASFCRFDPRVEGETYNFLPVLDKQEVFDRLGERSENPR